MDECRGLFVFAGGEGEDRNETTKGILPACAGPCGGVIQRKLILTTHEEEGQHVRRRLTEIERSPMTLGAALIIVVTAFVAFIVTIEQGLGVAFDTSVRILCAVIALVLVFSFVSSKRTERWPWIALLIATLVSAGLFFTPLIDRPSSRGEFILFLLPDTIILLTARLITFEVRDDRGRAARQTMVLGLVVAVVIWAGISGALMAG